MDLFGKSVGLLITIFISLFILELMRPLVLGLIGDFLLLWIGIQSIALFAIFILVVSAIEL